MMPRDLAQSRVFNRLALEPGRVIARRELVDYVYRDDPAGGPLWADAAVGACIFRLRRKGVPIVTHFERGFSLTPSRASGEQA